jgi:MFS family permease
MTLNTAYRMVYPFLPVLARSLGVDLRTMSLALSARSASGVLGPLLAPLTDRHGRRFGLSLGFGLFTMGALVAAFTAALVLMTIGKAGGSSTQIIVSPLRFSRGREGRRGTEASPS